MAQIKKEFEEANLTYSRELEKHVLELAGVKDELKKAKEAHKPEMIEAISGILQWNPIVVSH